MYWLVLLIAGVFILDFAEGFARCRVRSGHCWTTSNSRMLNTIKTNNTLGKSASCPIRGHFPHPDDTLLYYRCPDIGARACICRCRYEGMCFSPGTRRCEFAFLPDIHNCTSDVSTTTTATLPNNPKSLGSNATKTNAKHRKVMPVMLAKTEHIHRLHEPPQASHQVARHSFSARQAGPIIPGAPNDHVPFPLWAVAIVALSLLVMLVLIVILMYNNNIDYL